MPKEREASPPTIEQLEVLLKMSRLIQEEVGGARKIEYYRQETERCRLLIVQASGVVSMRPIWIILQVLLGGTASYLIREVIEEGSFTQGASIAFFVSLIILVLMGYHYFLDVRPLSRDLKAETNRAQKGSDDGSE